MDADMATLTGRTTSAGVRAVAAETCAGDLLVSLDAAVSCLRAGLITQIPVKETAMELNAGAVVAEPGHRNRIVHAEHPAAVLS